MSRRALGALVLALGAACSDAELIDPVPRGVAEDAGTTTSTTADAGSGGHGGDPGPPKRTVETRNPFGNVAKSENLLWDGDFEWSSAFSDQYGWLNYPLSTDAFGFDGIAIGSACRSGIKCASVAKGKGIIGIGVSSAKAKLSVSFWAKPQIEPQSAASCEKIDARLVGLTTNDPGVAIAASSEIPDGTGWCRFETVAEPQPQKVYLWIRNHTGVAIVVDDALIERVPATRALTAIADAPVTAALAAEIGALQVDLRRRARPVDPPPTPARRALEAWASRRKPLGDAR